MSCAKTVELTEMQFQMLSRVSPRNILHAVVDASTRRGTFKGMWPSEKYSKA